MNKPIVALALACIAALTAPARGEPAACAIEYRFAGHWDESPRRFEVELAFDAGERAHTTLRFQPDWGGISDFGRAHRGLRAVSPGARLADGPEPGLWTVAHPPGGRVALRYSVVNDVAQVDGPAGLPHRDFYRNRLGASHFQVFGYAVLVVPGHLPAFDEVDACLSFTGLPAGIFASSHGIATSSGEAALRVRTTPHALRAAVYLGGDFRLITREVGGRPLHVALRGRWSFDDARFADATSAIVGEHRRFWGDADFPRYLVSLVPNRMPHGQAGGTAVTDAFAMHASRDFAVPGAAFARMIGHEHLHTWLPGRIGAMGREEARHYWFSEGFTEYLTHRLLLRSGLWSLEDYAATLNAVLLEYAGSTARGLDNAGVLAAFWSDPAAGRIPYLRGELLALRWSNALAGRGDGLGAVLRGLLRDADASRDAVGDGPEDLATSRVLAALREALGPAADRDFEAFIERGEPVPADGGFLGPCFEGSRVAKPRFELGFDPASFRTRRLTGLVAGSAAEAAGLREGMELAGWSVRNGDAHAQALVQVKDGDRIVDLRFVPRAATPVEVHEFSVRPAAAQGAACRRWVAAP